MANNKTKKLGKPLDPTTDAQAMFGDATGKTGVTSSNQMQPTSSAPDQNPPTVTQIPEEFHRRAEDIATEPDEFDPDRSPDLRLNDIGDEPGKVSLGRDPGTKNFQHVRVPPPHYADEQSVSGTNADPDSDDDMLANAQMMGQQLEEDSEHPQEVDIARDINKAEEYVRE